MLNQVSEGRFFPYRLFPGVNDETAVALYAPCHWNDEWLGLPFDDDRGAFARTDIAHAKDVIGWNLAAACNPSIHFCV